MSSNRNLNGLIDERLQRLDKLLPLFEFSIKGGNTRMRDICDEFSMFIFDLNKPLA
jgi:hypothetical protein